MNHMTDTYTGLEPWNEKEDWQICPECGAEMTEDGCPNWCDPDEEEELTEDE